MLHIKAKTVVECWRESFKELYLHGLESQEKEFYRYDFAVVEIENVNEDFYDDRFPISRKDIEIINDYLVTGENEDEVIHEWTKIYRHRLFSENYSQIENIIKYLKKKPTGKRAQASIWKQEADMYGEIGPCLQIVWTEITDNKLDIHVHMRTSDCYGKFLMNLNEFAALQRYMAKRLGIETGRYVQFTDSLHFNYTDREKVENLIGQI